MEYVIGMANRRRQWQLDVRRACNRHLQLAKLRFHHGDGHGVHRLILCDLGDLHFEAIVAAVVVDDLLHGIANAFHSNFFGILKRRFGSGISSAREA